MTQLEEKEQLIEDAGVFFERRYQLPPLAARIFVLLILCPKEGHSFDDIVALSKSSKSSVSANINLLLQVGFLGYYTKPGQRKRFFTLSHDHARLTLTKYRENALAEISIIDRIAAYNKRYNLPRFEKHKKFDQFFKKYLKQHLKNLVSAINDMESLAKTV